MKKISHVYLHLNCPFIWKYVQDLHISRFFCLINQYGRFINALIGIYIIILNLPISKIRNSVENMTIFFSFYPFVSTIKWMFLVQKFSYILIMVSIIAYETMINTICLKRPSYNWIKMTNGSIRNHPFSKKTTLKMQNKNLDSLKQWWIGLKEKSLIVRIGA